MDAVPAVAISEAGTVAVSRVDETNVVANAVPFHFTVEVEPKFVPFTVNVNCAPPAVAQIGLSELMVGGALIVNVSVAVPVPLPLVALRVMLTVFAVVGLVMLGFGAASALLTTASTKRKGTIFLTGKS